MELFSISCPTCQARLKVRSTSAIGQILSCPKCQSMVQVVPPPGWQPPADTAAQPQAAGDTPTSPNAATPAAQPGGFERPFGFEQPEPPAWRIWAIGGVAAAVALIGSVTFFFGSSQPAQQPQAVSNEPPKYAGDGLKEEELTPDPKEETAKKEEPPKQDPTKIDLPKTDPPQVDPPKTDPPKVEVPQDPPKVDPPKVDPPKVDPPKVDPPKADPPKVEPPKADPPKADPPKVEPVAPVGLPRAVVEARLATKVESIQAPNVLLTDAIDTLAQISGLRITLDLDALSQAGVPGDETVSLDMQKTTVADALDRILEDRGLAYVIESGQLRITTRGKQRDAVGEESYDVADLCASAAAGHELAMLVGRVIESGGWTVAPRFDGGKLVVKHNDWVQRRTVDFLRRLRTARNAAALPQAAADQALASRLARAHEKLAKPLTVNFVEMSLTKIAQNLQSRSDLKLLFDALALAEAGQTPDARVTYQTREALPLGNVLFTILQPLDLTFRVIDEGTLQITSKAAALEQVELEFYRIRDLASAPDKVAMLVEKVRTDVFPGTWDVKADQAPSEPKAGRAQRGLLRPGLGFDAVSGCLVVSHHQPAQMQVEDLIDTLRRPVEPAAPAGGQQAQAAPGSKKK